MCLYHDLSHRFLDVSQAHFSLRQLRQLSRHTSFEHLFQAGQRHEQSTVRAMSIRPLPRHVAEQIKSSVIITSLNDVVCGLVRNSLDAEATVINVYLDYVKGGCTVEDNGDGIPPPEFRPDGGLGKAHRT